METETKSYNFTEKRAAQLEKARQKRWELHKQNTEPQGEEKPPEVEPPVVETLPPEPPEKEKEESTEPERPPTPPEPVRPPSPSPEPVRPPSPPPLVEKNSFQFTRNGTLLFYDE